MRYPSDAIPIPSGLAIVVPLWQSIKRSGDVQTNAVWSKCKMIAPVLDEIAKEYQGKLKICKLNIDENQETPPKYGVRGIPTLMLFKNGNVEATKVGALSKSQLAAFLDSNI